LRLGRIDDAIAAYDRALAAEPKESSSLWGRSIAWSKKGDKAKSDADAAAASKIEPQVEARFAEFGLTR
jgi:tetratricopeptide (TPR) repeat protein